MKWKEVYELRCILRSYCLYETIEEERNDISRLIHSRHSFIHSFTHNVRKEGQNEDLRGAGNYRLKHINTHRMTWLYLKMFRQGTSCISHANKEMNGFKQVPRLY